MIRVDRAEQLIQSQIGTLREHMDGFSFALTAARKPKRADPG
jgi:hypothetical protein